MGVKLTGVNELHAVLTENMELDAVKRIVRKHGADLQKRMQRRAEFKKGYQTGTTKRSIGLEIKDGGLTAVSGPQTEYSPYLEVGTRFMEAQPFVGPAFNDQKELFKRDLNRLAR